MSAPIATREQHKLEITLYFHASVLRSDGVALVGSSQLPGLGGKRPKGAAKWERDVDALVSRFAAPLHHVPLAWRRLDPLTQRLVLEHHGYDVPVACLAFAFGLHPKTIRRKIEEGLNAMEALLWTESGQVRGPSYWPPVGG